MKAGHKEILQKWDAYRKNIEREIDVPIESDAQKMARIEKLKGNFVEFCKYYFPQFCSAEFASFHKSFAKKVVSSDKLYIVRAWAREHAKSVNAGLFLPIYLMVKEKMHNMLLVSHSADNANELLMPIMVNLESNQRLINDYGKFKSWRGWEVGRFVTSSGCSFRAIGAGQSPRGTRNEEKRPDFILIDDIDTDEESRNQTRIDNKWKWIEQALFPTMSISGTKRFVVVGNIISKESIIVKASRVADDFEQIDILDKKGNPSWKERYALADVNYMLSKISYASGQKEYFNNPISEGTVFKETVWGKVPPLSKFKFLLTYGDGSYSNKETKTNSSKCCVLMGELDGNFYIINAFIESGNVSKMINWYYELRDYAKEKTQVYNYIECNGFQNPWYADVFTPALELIEKDKGAIPISIDDRDKPDKFSRIEGNLEPLNSKGKLIFNEAERGNPHMVRVENEFLAFDYTLKNSADGPDAVEGGYYIINTKLKNLAPIKMGNYVRNSKKY